MRLEIAAYLQPYSCTPHSNNKSISVKCIELVIKCIVLCVWQYRFTIDFDWHIEFIPKQN